MTRAVAYIGQVIVYAAIAALLGGFATWPSHTHFPDDQALIKLSFAHSAKHKVACRKRTAKELSKLAPNMRRTLSCPRERVPVYLELDFDGAPLFRGTFAPSGLSRDGPAQVYERFVVPVGRRHVVVRMRDSTRSEGFDYEAQATLDLPPRRNLVIGFRPEMGGFFFK